MSFETALISLQGDRSMNQDRCAVAQRDDSALLLLADGMGGHPRGEVAAQLLVDTGRRLFEISDHPIPQPQEFLDRILKTAHRQILAFGDGQTPPIDPRATAVVALVQDGMAYWSHVGDSRLYLFRDHRAIRRTLDHSFLEQMRRMGLLHDGQKVHRRYRNLVTRCLGGHGTHFGITRGPPTRLEPRDLLLLCSDGLWSQIPDDALSAMARHHTPLGRMVRELALDAQRSAHPGSDNVTVTALRWNDRAAIPAPEAAAGDGEAPPEYLDDAIANLKSAIADFESDND